MHGGGRTPPHAATCAFFRTPDEQLSRKRAWSPASGPASFVIHKAFPDGSAPRSSAPTTTLVHRLNKEAVKRNTLQSALWALIAQAELNVIDEADLDRAAGSLADAQRARLEAAVAVHTMWKDPDGKRDVALSDTVSFTPHAFPIFAKSLREMRWPAGIRPQGLVIGVGEGFEAPDIAFARGVISVTGRVSVFGEPKERALRPPYLCLVSAAQASRADRYVQAVQAYLHPILDRSRWLPVDSGHERTTAGCLMAAMKRLRAKNIRVRLIKPLYDVSRDERPDAEVLVPDFVLEVSEPGGTRPRNLIVETMGYDDEWYLSDKHQIHALMEEQGLGEVIRFDAFRRPACAQPGCDFDREFLRTLYGRIGI